MSSPRLTWKSLLLFTSLAAFLVAAAWVTDKKARERDHSIQEMLTTDFAAEERFHDIQAQVTNGGVVSLTGSVKVLEDKRQALNKATAKARGRKVKDRITVNTVWIPDGFLRRDLTRKLHDQHLTQVRVKVKKGVVTVRGTVPTKADRDGVLLLISTTEGVKDVVDRTIIRRIG